MGLFNWLFGINDDVEDSSDGSRGKVKGFKPEGLKILKQAK